MFYNIEIEVYLYPQINTIRTGMQGLLAMILLQFQFQRSGYINKFK